MGDEDKLNTKKIHNNSRDEKSQHISQSREQIYLGTRSDIKFGQEEIRGSPNFLFVRSTPENGNVADFVTKS